MLLLRRDPRQSWAAAEIARQLYIPEDMAVSLLADLARNGFASAASGDAPRYTYPAANPQLDPLIDELAAVYQERRVAVISLIYSKPIDKVQTFADAFRLRKENPP
jgi:hypothetical protein